MEVENETSLVINGLDQMPKFNLIQMFINLIINTKVKYQSKIPNKCIIKYNIAILGGKISSDLSRRKVASVYSAISFYSLSLSIYGLFDC